MTPANSEPTGSNWSEAAIDKWRTIEALDLTPVAQTLRAEFRQRQAKPALSGEELERQVARLEHDYRQYLFLRWKYPSITLGPNFSIDAAWRAHIANTPIYREHSEKVFHQYFDRRPEEDLSNISFAEYYYRANKLRNLSQQEFRESLEERFPWMAADLKIAGNE